MTIRFTCEKCGKKLKAGDDQAGSRFKCTRCGQFGFVPGEAARKSKTADEEPQEAPQQQRAKFTDEDEGMDMTPMVDVTFLLLIFFMITAAFSLQKSMEVPPPDVEDAVAQERTLEELEEDDDFIVVNIDEESIIWVDEQEAPTRQAIIRLITERRDQGGSPPTNLLVTVHPEAKHNAQIMVFDVGNHLGMTVNLGSSPE